MVNLVRSRAVGTAAVRAKSMKRMAANPGGFSPVFAGRHERRGRSFPRHRLSLDVLDIEREFTNRYFTLAAR
jgi:hypothetical protein